RSDRRSHDDAGRGARDESYDGDERALDADGQRGASAGLHGGVQRDGDGEGTRMRACDALPPCAFYATCLARSEARWRRLPTYALEEASGAQDRESLRTHAFP